MCIALQLISSLLLILLLRKKPRADTVSGILCDPEPTEIRQQLRINDDTRGSR